ncbi:MinD/ParA family ATP-binding protein [Psychromicrobium lacuslunae]|uniref:MinD/ParA family ATP-binding protein n=1 Tax=Psychromicrobium lacuslunae TaxID=1618207 RepID=UPI000A67B7D6|nr:MinD/ParA family protein [Psychromicrobium lacuslunae]
MPTETEKTEPSHGELSSDSAADPSSTGVVSSFTEVIVSVDAEDSVASTGDEASAKPSELEPAAGDSTEPEAAVEPASKTAQSVASESEQQLVVQPEAEELVTEQAASEQLVGESGTSVSRAGEPTARESNWQPSGSQLKLSATAETSLQNDSEAQRSSARRGQDQQGKPEPAAALTADRLLESPQTPPVAGWRRWLYQGSFGYINVGDSDKVRLQRVMEHRIAARLGQRTRYIPVLSRKGGVGKTTVTTLLGMVLANMREDRVIAMDANPDRGTLSDRSPGRADHTARQLVRNRFTVNSFSELASYVARDGSRLDVLASDTDPAIAEAFDDADYRAVTDILSRYYSIVLTDSGTGMVHSVMKGTLEKADTVVLVSGGSVDEARLASETLSWLEAHGRQDLVAKAIVVVNMSAGEGTRVNIDQIEDHFRSRVKSVIRLPYDKHLAEGSRVDLNRLNPATKAAVIELAALTVDELQGL